MGNLIAFRSLGFVAEKSSINPWPAKWDPPTWNVDVRLREKWCFGVPTLTGLLDGE